MATFPALQPQTRTYTPGATPSTAIMVLNGNETSVRHTNGSVSTTIRLTFNAISRSDQNAIIAHYNTHNRFIPFDLDAITLIASGLTLPAAHQWIYARPPSMSETCSSIDVEVELELIPPYNI
jgi:hypothetical protein